MAKKLKCPKCGSTNLNFDGITLLCYDFCGWQSEPLKTYQGKRKVAARKKTERGKEEDL